MSDTREVTGPNPFALFVTGYCGPVRDDGASRKLVCILDENDRDVIFHESMVLDLIKALAAVTWKTPIAGAAEVLPALCEGLDEHALTGFLVVLQREAARLRNAAATEDDGGDDGR